MDRGLDWFRNRKVQVEAGAEATGKVTGEVKVTEVRAEAMIEEDKKNQEGKDQKLQMREVEAGQMTEWIRTPNKGKGNICLSQFLTVNITLTFRSLDRRSEEKTKRQRSATPDDKGRDRSEERARSEEKDMNDDKRRY